MQEWFSKDFNVLPLGIGIKLCPLQFASGDLYNIEQALLCHRLLIPNYKNSVQFYSDYQTFFLFFFCFTGEPYYIFGLTYFVFRLVNLLSVSNLGTLFRTSESCSFLSDQLTRGLVDVNRFTNLEIRSV